MDARLTEKGRAQCRLFSESIALERAHLFDTELGVTSPLTRCLERQQRFSV
jgi:broad specificity phosphatase PhoE